MALSLEQPSWSFYFGWVALSTHAILLAFGGIFLVLALTVDWIGEWIIVDWQKHITEDYLFSFVFPVMIWLLTSGLQYALLRRYLPEIGGWILATGAGWLVTVAMVIYFDRVFPQKIDLSLTIRNVDFRWTIFLSVMGH